MDKISVTHLSNAHNGWLRSLEFYKQELGILQDQLTEVAKKNSAVHVMKEVEHYENQFKIQIENIHRLKHDIKHNLTITGKEAKAAPAGYIDGVLVSAHDSLGQTCETEEKIINELRHSFQKFAAEWM